MEWVLVKRKLSEIKAYEKNPRTFTKEGLINVKRSLNEFGLAEPLVLNTDNTLIGGHARYSILTSEKDVDLETEIDCYIPKRKLTNKQVKELNIRLNKNIAGDFDLNILSSQFKAADLIEWGFKPIELESFDINIDEFFNDNGSEKNLTRKIEKLKCPDCGHEFEENK